MTCSPIFRIIRLTLEHHKARATTTYHVKRVAIPQQHHKTNRTSQ